MAHTFACGACIDDAVSGWRGSDSGSASATAVDGAATAADGSDGKRRRRPPLGGVGGGRRGDGEGGMAGHGGWRGKG